MESELIAVPGTDDRSVLQQSGEDTFNVHVNEDIGELFKIRLGFDDVSDSASWYLETVSATVVILWCIFVLSSPRSFLC
jgi:hypothetical protein